MSNRLSETLEATAFVGVWMAGIDSSKGSPPFRKAVDFREGYRSVPTEAPVAPH